LKQVCEIRELDRRRAAADFFVPARAATADQNWLAHWHDDVCAGLYMGPFRVFPGSSPNCYM